MNQSLIIHRYIDGKLGGMWRFYLRELADQEGLSNAKGRGKGSSSYAPLQRAFRDFFP